MIKPKLTGKDAVEIRRRHAEGGVSNRQLAVAFGVSPTMISMIIGHKRYRGGPRRIYTRQADPPDRVCRVCHARKVISEFPLLVWKNRRSYNGAYQWRETRCRECIHAYDKQRINNAPHRARRRITFESFRHRVRAEVLEHYGGRCACCGESTNEFLAIDHIDGGGKQHREELGLRGAAFYNWIIKNGFPVNLRVLCHSCNLSKGLYGYCPHEVQRTAEALLVAT